MEKDGNLGVVSRPDRRLASSNPARSPSAELVLPTDDGNLVIYNRRGKSILEHKMIIGAMYPGNRIYAPAGRGEDRSC